MTLLHTYLYVSCTYTYTVLYIDMHIMYMYVITYVFTYIYTFMYIGIYRYTHTYDILVFFEQTTDQMYSYFTMPPIRAGLHLWLLSCSFTCPGGFLWICFTCVYDNI